MSRNYTINLHKAVHKETFKRKALRAVSHIVRFGIRCEKLWNIIKKYVNRRC